MTTEEKIEIIKAFDEGKEIEIYLDGKWYDKGNNSFWDFRFNKYRVKPHPTRLEVANEFFEKTFGVKNAFDESNCIAHCCTPCSECVAYKDGGCDVENWWNTPCEKPKGE